MPKHRRSDCKKGHHEYGSPRAVGAGILREACRVCGAVKIDLNNAEPLPGLETIVSLAPQDAEAD